MPRFELENIRHELHAAIKVLELEPTDSDEYTGENRARIKAIDHVTTALLLLRGANSIRIVGRLVPPTGVEPA